MFDILHACESGDLYTVEVAHLADVEELVGARHVEAVSTMSIVFWFNPRPHPLTRQVNPLATELLLATTRFTARSVPLLLGSVVMTRQDGAGDLAGFSQRQLRWLIDTHPTYWDELILGRRFARDRRRQRRVAGATARAL